MRKLQGKVVRAVKQVRGSNARIEYVITFTDGTVIRFSGNSSADVGLFIDRNRARK